MDKKYIARKYVATDTNARHYYEEGIFSSYEKAYSFILAISDEDEDIFLSEIVGFDLDSHDANKNGEVTIFDRRGKVLLVDKSNDDGIRCMKKNDGTVIIRHERDPLSYSGKYKIGDIVFIRAFPWNPYSPTQKDTIGVVSNVPIFYEQWVSNRSDNYEWDNTYTIDCIRDGYLGHWHVVEQGLIFLDSKIPHEQKIISVLSDHYRGSKKIPSILLKKLSAGDIFVENVEHYNF